jgi:flagellar biosynthesis GTPase FlhF
MCPICGRGYIVDELDKLSLCISKHKEDIAAEKDKEKTENIERLKRDNLELISKINENCKELKKLGVNASVNYSQTNSNDGAVKNIRTSNIYKSTEDYSNDFANILEKEIEKERAKLTPEERENVDNFEKKLRTILGLY